MAAGVGAWATGALNRDDTPPPITARMGSEEVAGPEAPALRTGEEPAAYRIVYRLEQGGDDVPSVLTDVLSVQRPFRSRLETKRGAPPGGSVLSEQVSRLGHLETRGRERATATFASPAGIAASDIRVAAILPDLVERGLAERREQREVAGRRCQVYRTLGPLSAKSVAPPTEEEFADNCIDGQGLVLEELFVLDGTPISRRVAVEVDLSPTFADGAFRTEKVTIPVDKGGGSFKEVEPDSRPEGDEPFWELPSPPAGFTHLGRFSVVPPQAENFSDPLRTKFILATVSDVYDDGEGGAIVIDQGATLQGGAAFGPSPEGTPVVDGGAVGQAEVHLSAEGAELRVHTGSGQFVRVLGTVPVDDLLRVLRSLVPQTGTGLVYLGGG